MSCQDEENYLRDTRTGRTTVKTNTTLTDYVFFGLLSWLQQLLLVFVLSLPLPHPALPAYLRRLLLVDLPRRVLQQQRKVLFLILICQSVQGTLLLAASEWIPNNVSPRRLLLHRASCEDAGAALADRHWTFFLSSCTDILNTECLYTRRRTRRAPFHVCKEYVNEKRGNRFVDHLEAYSQPSWRSSCRTNKTCSFARARSGSVVTVLYFSCERYGDPTTSIRFVYRGVRVHTGCEPTCVAYVPRIATLRTRLLQSSVLEGVCALCGRAGACVGDCSLRKTQASKHLRQPISSLRIDASSVAFLGSPPPCKCACVQALGAAVNCLLPRFAGATTVEIGCRSPIRYGLQRRRPHAVTATAAPITYGAVRSRCLTLLERKTAGGVPLLRPSPVRPATFGIVPCDCGTPVEKQPNLCAAHSRPREGECFVPSEELSGNPYVEDKFKTAAALLQDERLDRGRGPDGGEGDRKDEKEARQREYCLVKKRRETKPKKQVKKEIRLTPRIAAHDLMVKAKQARQFLLEKKQVLFSVHLRGRELAACTLHRVLLERVAEMLDDVAAPTSAIQQKGNSLTQLFQYRRQKKVPPSSRVPNVGGLRGAPSSAALRATSCL